MCINEYENYTEREKVCLLQDYIDYLTFWNCVNYDLICDIELNNVKKRKFLKAVVPYWFDCISFPKIFKTDELYDEFKNKIETSYKDIPMFFAMACVCWALDCFNDTTLTLKKILWRWSKILLNY